MWPLRLTGAVCGASKTNTSWKLCITTSTPANESDVQPIILYYTEYLFIYFTILSKSSVHHKIIILSSGVNDHICFFFLLFLSSSTSSQKHAGRTVSCSDLFKALKHFVVLTAHDVPSTCNFFVSNRLSTFLKLSVFSEKCFFREGSLIRPVRGSGALFPFRHRLTKWTEWSCFKHFKSPHNPTSNLHKVSLSYSQNWWSHVGGRKGPVVQLEAGSSLISWNHSALQTEKQQRCCGLNARCCQRNHWSLNRTKCIPIESSIGKYFLKTNPIPGVTKRERSEK